MRGRLAAIAAFLVLGAAIVLVVPSLVPQSCGCASTPTPVVTPVFAHSWAEAQAVASRFTDRPLAGPSRWTTAAGTHLWDVGTAWDWTIGTADGSDVTVYVDADDGHLAAILDLSRMPVGPSSGTSRTRALTVAEEFLATRGVLVDGLTESAWEAGLPGQEPQAWTVAWADSSGAAVTVAIDSATGAVYWFSDRRGTSLQMRAPLVGHDAAKELALASAPDPEQSFYQTWTFAFHDDGTETAGWRVKTTSTRYAAALVDGFTGAVTWVE